MRQKRRGQGSMTARLRALLLVFVPVFVVTLVINSVVLDYTRAQNEQYLVNSVELYVKDIDKTIANVNRRMRVLLLGSGEGSQRAATHIQTADRSADQVMVNYAINQLKLIFGELVQEYGSDKNFFLYFESKKRFVRLTEGSFSQREHSRFESIITGMILSDEADVRTGLQSWRSFMTDESEYAIMKLYRSGDVYMGCWIRAKDLVAPLNQLNFGAGGLVTLSDDQSGYLTGRERLEAMGVALSAPRGRARRPRRSWFQNQLVVTRQFTNAPYAVELLISNYGTYENLVTIQLLLGAMSLLVFISMLIASYYLQRRILRPIKSFTRSLQRIRNGATLEGDIGHSDLAELEQANAEFMKLMGEVQRLKMQMYEREIEYQAVQLDYLKLQIKPHFYLNCLNFIYNMIDLGEYDSAMHMSRVTSDYLRYLLRGGDELVTLDEEFSHVCDYMQIQKMRYDAAVQFRAKLDPAARGVKLPPLVVQTFVENSIKHALSLEGGVEVSVDARLSGGNRVSVVIRDTGEGFDPDTLARLNIEGGARGPDGVGIGIDNCLKRLYHYYGSDASVQFENGVGGGAVVRVTFPASLREGGGTD